MNKIVAVALGGRLGNQLFKYAIARHIAIKNGIDKVYYTIESGNVFELGEYDLPLFPLTDDVKPIDQLKVIDEPHFNYSPEILNLEPSIYLRNGVWQSYKYLEGIEDILSVEFTPFKKVITDKAIEILKEIKSIEMPILIGTRGGDYLGHFLHDVFSGMIFESPFRQPKYIPKPDLRTKYYSYCIKRALEENKGKNIKFYIFSDDINWSKSFMDGLIDKYKINAQYMDGLNKYEQLYIGSFCKYAIIVNSSYTYWQAKHKPPELDELYWAGWFGHKKNVLYPSRWFNDLSINTTDLCPSDWNPVSLTALDHVEDLI